MHHENSLIAAFVKRNKRDRYREIISDSRLRHKFTSQLAGRVLPRAKTWNKFKALENRRRVGKKVRSPAHWR